MTVGKRLMVNAFNFALFLWFNFNGFFSVKEKEQSGYVTVVPSPHTQTVEDIQFHYCHGFL
jgi:hypothetical protein